MVRLKIKRLRSNVPRFLRKQSHKTGKAPGTLIFAGQERTEAARIQVIDYVGDQFEERELANAAEAALFRDSPSVSWINVDGVHDVELVRELGESFGIHALVLEDVLNTGHRPKAEELEEHIFIVVKMLYYDPDNHLLNAEQVGLIIGKQFVISFQEKEGDVFEPVRERLRSSSGRIRQRGPDYLAYALLDIIIDHYFTILESMSAQIEELEVHILERAGPETQQNLAALRRELILLRKAVWPVRDVVSVLERSESPLISKDTRPFLRDAYDHSVQVIDIVESLRDMIGVLRDSYQSIQGNRMNEIMKVLTIIATIFIPLTFVAGIYGMNFDNMPELHARNGYFYALGAMAVLGLGLGAFFKWKKWV